MATTGQFAEHLAPDLREIIGTRFGGRVSFYSQLLNVENSSRNFEEILAGAGMPIATEKPERKNIDAFDPLEGSKKRISHTVYGIAMEVSEEADMDDLYKGEGSALQAGGNGLADSLAEVVEVQAHRMFNSEAFLTSGVPGFLQPLPDLAATVGIYNTSHGPVTGGEAPGQSNRPATAVDLTVTSLRTALAGFRRYRDDRNKRIPAVSFPNRIVVPPELEWDAREILQSTNRPDTANRVENVTPSLSIVVDPYLDDTDAWFLLAQKHWLTFLWRMRPRMDAFDDRRARVAIFLAYQRFGLSASHWLGTYGSPGA